MIGRGLVVDASVAVKWHLPDEEYLEEASALLIGFRAGRLELTAPAFIRYELAQALERARRGRRVVPAEATTALASFLSFGIHVPVDSDEIVASAQRISQQTGISAYDATYVAHAEALGFDLVTADDKLARSAARDRVSILRLAEIAALL